MPRWPVKTLKDRFLEKVIKNKETGCWEWTACCDPHGYARIKDENNYWDKASRVSYKLFKGVIPLDICVCHSCDRPICVNPDHLWLGTQRDNIIDSVKKGRHKNPIFYGQDNPMSETKRLEREAL